MEGYDVSFQQVETDEQLAKTAELADVIWHECYEHLLKPEQIDYMVERMQSASAMRSQIQEEEYQYYLIILHEKNGDAAAATPQYAGYIGVQAKENKMLLSKLYLENTYRGRGLANLAMDFVEQCGRKQGCAAVWLTVNRQNDRAISMYRRVGFQQTGQVDTDIGGGFVMNDFIFEKPL